MKILFLVYHGFSASSGITKKIHYQVKGLRQNGHEVHLCYYDFTADGHRCRFVNDSVIRDYGNSKLSGLRQRIDYGCIYDYCLAHNIQFVYARCFQNANPWLISFFRKLRKAGVRAVTEIPTYPYDAEFAGFDMKMRMELWIDKMFRRKLYQYMDAVVTFSDAQNIFGQQTINISNGVDFDSIPLHQYNGNKTKDIHLIGVAEVHYWHGFDRILAGMGEYYKHMPKGRQVFFHIVGGIHPAYMNDASRPYHGYKSMIEQYGIADKVLLHGQLFGEQLNDVFNQCVFAIGSLGRHRSGITTIKTLKNREYATRGIPFIYSEQDSDFDLQPYIIKAPADETPIDIQQIIDFVDAQTMSPSDIRHTVEHLTWKIQMQKVVDFIAAL